MREILSLFAIFIGASALFSYINHRWLKFPRTIGVMLISVVLGITLKLFGTFAPGVVMPIRQFVLNFNFSAFVLDFILCFLLFAGALHVNMSDLRGARRAVLLYSVLGTLISTIVVGVFTHLCLAAFGIAVGWIPCLVFGALISPTDPIAVIGILSKYKIPVRLKTEIVGESLFNDGVAVVLFTLLFAFANTDARAISGDYVIRLIVFEVLGGIFLGAIIGYAGYLLLRTIDHYQTEIMITLALVTGGYSLASVFHFSGPLAMVIAGLIIGNKVRSDAMSEVTEDYIDIFWELIDEICNTVLFLLMGLQVLLLSFRGEVLIVGSVLIFVVLLARFISLLPAFLLFKQNSGRKLNLAVLTWGGLRGGISIALALSIGGKIEGSEVFIDSTCIIVIFSILVQGLTIKKLLVRYSQ